MRATHSYNADVIEAIFHGISWTLLIIYQNTADFQLTSTNYCLDAKHGKKTYLCYS